MLVQALPAGQADVHGSGNRRRLIAPVFAGNYHEILSITDALPRRPRDGRYVLILLTNDDGIYAPGLAAMERELERLGEVYVVAPATEQSGVGHSITFT